MSESPDNLRKRIEQVNRAPLPEGQGGNTELNEFRRKLSKRTRERPQPAQTPIVYQRDLPHVRPSRRKARRVGTDPIVLEQAVSGVEAEGPDGGKAFVIEVRLADHEEDWASLCEAFRCGFAGPGASLSQRLRSYCANGEPGPEDILFLDLETTGLSSTPVFLVGTMAWDGDDLVLRQYLARDYAEERAILSLSLAEAARKQVLVSFNGKSFDVPYLRTRAAANAVPFTMCPAHCDLLHEARRVWKHVLPNCRLQTLESYICHRPRHDDIPGHEIPEAYHAFVRTGDAFEIVEILKHNLLDLVSLADIMTRLAEADSRD